MVYARALRALECITHAGPSPALGTQHIIRSVAQLVARHVWDVEVPGSSPGTPT